ncbi:MFS transporter [Aspergillus steynii IBT 23096]|uniref:MFS transporter n=1 Tax=Aspergillus steynii IBT 23096 TaxID=1392250 RepID=A0A2I2GMT3_9EURO|nr:MFS transporter [Aspergillus steynii IBT 23096]PLB54192.1 MFS transporter [Aspergillus steynii IBT 23096]
MPSEEYRLVSNGEDDETESVASFQKPAGKSNKLAILIAYLGAVLSSSEESLVTATYSIIASDFQELSKSSLLLTSYNLGYCIALPVYGALADLFGRKFSLLLGYFFFGLGCVICTIGTSINHLVIGRAIGGTGSAGMVVMISIMITDFAPPSEVALLRSYTNLSNLIGRSFGAPLGSLVTSTFGWRWAFGGRLPVILACFLLAKVYMPDINPPQKDKDASRGEKLKSIDYAGTAAFAAAIVPFLLALVAVGDQNGGGSSYIYKLLAVSAVFCIAFVLVECLWVKRPLVPLQLVWQGVGQYWLVQLLIFIGRLAMTTNIAEYLTQVKGVAGEVASIFIIFPGVGFTSGALAAGYTIKRYLPPTIYNKTPQPYLCIHSLTLPRTKRYKKHSIAAIILGIVFSALLFRSWHETSSIWESLLIIPISAATGFTLSCEFIGVSSRAPQEHLAPAIGAYYLSQQLGMIIGSAIGPVFVRRGFVHEMGVRVQDGGERNRIISDVLADSRFHLSLPDQVRGIVQVCLAFGYQFIPLTSVVTMSLALPIFIMKREERIE